MMSFNVSVKTVLLQTSTSILRTPYTTDNIIRIIYHINTEQYVYSSSSSFGQSTAPETYFACLYNTSTYDMYVSYLLDIYMKTRKRGIQHANRSRSIFSRTLTFVRRTSHSDDETLVLFTNINAVPGTQH